MGAGRKSVLPGWIQARKISYLPLPKQCLTAGLTLQEHGETYRGGGRGGTKPTCRIPLSLLGTPGIVMQLLKWNFKVTFLGKPWALVRKYLRLAPKELSASMMVATQFLEGCHPYTCAASVWHVLSSSGAKRKYLIFICLPMIWNDEECWSLRKINAKIEF